MYYENTLDNENSVSCTQICANTVYGSCDDSVQPNNVDTRQKMNELELLRTVPAELLPYYRERVNEYFNTLELDSEEQPDLKP